MKSATTSARRSRHLEPALDPLGIARCSRAVLRAWQAHPDVVMQPTLRWWTDFNRLVFGAMQAACGMSAPPVIEAAAHDRRFAHPAWRRPPYTFVLQAALLQERWIEEALGRTAPLCPVEASTVEFWLTQWQDACSPSNALALNPEALDKAVATRGESLLQGLNLLWEDACAGEVRMAPRGALRVGTDLGASAGAVVYRNALFELVQYRAATGEVAAVPIVVIAPWINKFYILDLTPQTSLVAHLVRAGYTVFAVSWKNPGADRGDTGFEDYVLEGARRAVEVAREICGVPAVHAVGYCIGGTALATLMAWLAAGTDGAVPPVAHWTLLATLVDFSHPGPVQAFTNDEAISTVEALMAHQGCLDGRQMALTFRLLRARSLYWHYVVHDYLLGENPRPSPVLQWNMDTTRVPRRAHGWYLRQCYLNNALRRRNAVVVSGRALDMRRIAQPLYGVGCEDDHITPWASTFANTQLVGGPVRYALTTSGHILGIVNPPADPPVRSYRAGDVRRESAQAWRERQAVARGSWWDDWTAWLAERCGDAVPAREIGSARHPPLAPAPGTYVYEP